jgi:hypothetical protein
MLRGGPYLSIKDEFNWNLEKLAQEKAQRTMTGGESKREDISLDYFRSPLIVF